MEQIRERGLLPIDFLKHGHDNPDAVEALYDNDPTLARMSVSDPQHICNVLSEEELQMLCAQPEGSKQWFKEEAVNDRNGRLGQSGGFVTPTDWIVSGRRDRSGQLEKVNEP